MKFTKLLAAILTLCLLLATFVACVKDTSSSDPDETKTNESTNLPEESESANEKDTSSSDPNETETNESTNLPEESESANGKDTSSSDPNETETNESANLPEESESANKEQKYKILSIGDFYCGLALIKADTGYGYINTNGEIVIEPYFDEASDVFNVLAVVTEGNTKKYINKKAETVYLFNGEETGFGTYSNGFFWIETMEETISGNVYTITYYNQNGEKQMSITNAKEAIDQIPEHNLNAWNEVTISLSSFNEWGYTIVNIGEKNKFVDTNGNVVVFDGLKDSYNVRRYQDNYVLIDSNLYYIDYANKTATLLSDGYWAYAYEVNVQPLKNEYYGNYMRYTYYKVYTQITNKNNNTNISFVSIPELGGATVKAISSFTYEEETYFVLYLVSSSDVFWSAVIDSKGNVMFAPTNKFHLGYNSYYVRAGGSYAYCDYSCYSFSSGLCKALDSETNMYGYIDISGNWVIEPVFSTAGDFYGEGDESVAVVNNNTIIDKNGNVVFTIISGDKNT